LFIIPWSDHWIIGTTDTDWDLDRAHPAATSNDISYLLKRVNELLENKLDTNDIQGVYVGLRPLLTGESNDTAKLSREHHVFHPTPGVVSIAGGKYTTYRVMASDAVNAAVTEVPRWVSPSKTKEIRLIGAANFLKLEEKIISLATENNIDVATARHLLDRHGDRIHEVFDIIAESPELIEQLSPGYPYLRAEVVHAARFECALHLEDVLTRRTRLSIESWDRASDAAPDAASLMAAELGWTSEYRDLEIQTYNERVVAERKSQTYFDDETAQSSRLAAMDSRHSV
jgi:glycerol-3-phosphate dehydrogenase